MYHRLRHLIGWMTIAAALTAADADAASAVVGVRAGEQAEATRFVMDLSDSVDFEIFLLDNPYRVVVDFPVLDWRVPGTPGLKRGLIDGFRFGLFDQATSRLVLDVNRPVEVRRSFILPPSGALPFRFVIDLAEVAQDRFQRVAALPTQQAGPVQLIEPRTRPATPRVGPRVIVLDPGHGGIDPGTIGRRGSQEKALTLQIASQAREALEATGRYRVLLTREDDVFVRLRDRVAFARRHNADLFISLHADALSDRSVRGASVYTLSEKASDQEADALAQRENKADLIAGVDLENEPSEIATILIDLARRETMNLSATFATLVLPEFERAGKTLRKGHRFAGFAVLKAPDVPSVLIELGYLSNPADERQLTDRTFQKVIGASIQKAVDSYFSGLSQ
ncbi:MAG: N-acetylmuramoyl-L-alanine amidase [Proteobacteria bacterium]|nr:N-acetylmuramoyl-L-alanine amidase [Pseudomonadota bacterium]MDA1058173.1 N-acetylmuramoyl-L-alanine amidase [Pseudomonadota bacterium]